MKTFLKTLLIAALSFGFAACGDDDDYIDPELNNSLPCNYANIAGNWQLVSYNDIALQEGTYLYITFERRNPHNFQMYDNLQSMYGQKRTGTYMLEDDDDKEVTILSGIYDNGVGTWNNEYTITYLSENQLRLTTIAAPHETQVYTRVESLPESLL